MLQILKRNWLALVLGILNILLLAWAVAAYINLYIVIKVLIGL